MAKKNYENLAKEIVRYIGGVENVNTLIHCATRLRFKVKNTQNVDKKKLEQLEGVITVLDSGGQIQVVIGQHVADVYDTIFEVTDLKKENPSDAEESGEKKNLLNTFMDTISGIFAPVLGVMSGAGMLKALLILCTTFGWLKSDMGTYRILYAAADGVFTFIPVFLAYTAAKKFRANEFVAVGVAAALLYPDLTAAYSAGEALTFLKIPVVLVSYTSSVIPIVISVYALSKLEKGLKRIVPTVCKTFLTPLLSLAIMVPATYLVIGPIADTVGKALASGYTGLVGLNPVIAGGLLGLIWPAAVMFGVHWGFVPIVMNNIAEYGRDTLFTITGPNNMAQAGATLGVFLKTKDKSVKELAGPAALSAVLAGITEPAIYGVTLRFKRPFFIGAVFSGIAGAIVAAAGTGAPTLLGTSILTLPGYIGVGFVGFLIACAIAYFGSAIVTYFFGYSDDMLPKKEEKKEEPQEIIPAKDEALLAPVSGKVIPLSEVRDEAFAGGILGQGAAVIPENGEICAPCDGVISVMYPTGHAVGIKSDIGAEILIHVGMDTVTLNGSCFDVKVKAGDYVKAGQLLVRANIEGIKKEGLDITTPVIVANTADYMQIKTVAEESVKSGEVLLNCVSK
ncbi:beta-glucoside-specific PTS transporter subunit IIABC [Mediterraneibacter gnavus]|uniref:PTS beta-glucoside transporter subunit EIIBCA n=1 Tax=Mediterraneibacter gnavus TaxID=33038 RepID=A0A2N5PDP5_MEDGN|nr:beta-glucoside-specific PTS transporter subunit IIABC [Mediterraneibacter gnavus]MDB8709580.1 beta-glucoside-specific PTS transporter subunit IIABC [Mediterraneibacter gnavus]MDB8712346.1 beta-glucoside-specific PTS transporter subunit IIABC [Mediterraneibacter gnavus]PLT73271.1 PTS beta-glucoside transporter subunit EIIBCA [Mediterraneibacter gnavus]